MSKKIAERTKSFSIFWLKKNGCFNGGLERGDIEWVNNNDKNSITFYIMTKNKFLGDNIKLQYTFTNQKTGEKEDIDCEIELTTTPCNYGGKRYWFVCPLVENEKICGRRVGVLFLIDKQFGCRHCGNFAYDAQMSGGRFRMSSVTIPAVTKAAKEVKRCYYNGKPTRKYKRVLRLNNKLKTSIIKIATKCGQPL
ncbi:MAG: hypothetical protein V1664_02370 [Candidatus Uhrbacteria bacterium]